MLHLMPRNMSAIVKRLETDLFQQVGFKSAYDSKLTTSASADM
jgi:hypothetical protein